MIWFWIIASALSVYLAFGALLTWLANDYEKHRGRR